MKSLRPIIALCLAAPLFAACADTWNLGGIQKAPSVGTPFQQALHREYIALALAERDEQDWVDAGMFGERADKSSRGMEVMPEEIAARELPEDAVGTLTAARERLVAALAGGAASKPEQAAAAQAAFDCWMQEQEENHQPEDIAACREKFEAAMSAFAMAKPMPKMAEPKPMPKQAGPDTYSIYFAFDSAVVDAEAQRVIDTAAQQFRAMGARTAFVSGHADTSGSSAYNDRLSQARTQAVADALAAAGVPSGAINQRFFGEDRPVVNAGDGVRNQLNRRVDIELQK